MRENLSSCKSSIQLNAAALGFSLSLICGPMDMHFHIEPYTGLFNWQNFYNATNIWILSRKKENTISKPLSSTWWCVKLCTKKPGIICTLAVKSFVLHQRKKTWVVNFLIESSSKKKHIGAKIIGFCHYTVGGWCFGCCVWKVQDSLSNVCFCMEWEEPVMRSILCLSRYYCAIMKQYYSSAEIAN